MDKSIAKALVECGYAYSWQSNRAALFVTIPVTSEIQKVDPFADTIEGRRQADALEDWLAQEHGKLWGKSADYVGFKFHWHYHQWRLDRIKWCFQRLEKHD